MKNSKQFIFHGKVFHQRVFPKKHKFVYKYESLYVKNIYSFSKFSFLKQSNLFFKFDYSTSQVKDNIVPWIKKIIKDFSLDVDFLELNILKTPNTFFKKAFNPVCFWFINYKDQTIAVIAEVTNTFKEQHSYFLDNGGKPITDTQWFKGDKKLYVSPFADRIGKYEFNFNQNPLKVKINEFDPKNNLEIITSLKGEYIVATGFLRFMMYIRILSNSFIVAPRIHIQAFYLWMKKLKFYSHNGSGHVK
jgi:DUF1365 family protein|tara:strand:- start:4150 stop:4890 length:741 start_codon:yes stop_codon:yes gene_type:complete